VTLLFGAAAGIVPFAAAFFGLRSLVGRWRSPRGDAIAPHRDGQQGRSR
jgi:hypothetical protein